MADVTGTFAPPADASPEAISADPIWDETAPSPGTETAPVPSPGAGEPEGGEGELTASQRWAQERIAEISELPEDEQAAALAEFEQSLPEHLRSQLPSAQTAEEERQRREAQTRTRSETERMAKLVAEKKDTANRSIGAILAHLDEVKAKRDSGEEAEYNRDGILAEIGRIADAHAEITNHDLRDATAQAIFEKINAFGQLFTEDDDRAVLTSLPQGAPVGKVLGAYLDVLADRAAEAARADERAKNAEENKKWRKAESAAIRTEFTKEYGTANTEPQRLQRGRSASGDDSIDGLFAQAEENLTRMRRAG